MMMMLVLLFCVVSGNSVATTGRRHGVPAHHRCAAAAGRQPRVEQHRRQHAAVQSHEGPHPRDRGGAVRQVRRGADVPGRRLRDVAHVRQATYGSGAPGARAAGSSAPLEGEAVIVALCSDATTV